MCIRDRQIPVIATSSTCAFTIRDEYPHLLGIQNKVSILTIKAERQYFNSLCEFFKKPSHQENSLLDREKDIWIKQLKLWMMQIGRALTKYKVTSIQTESVEKAALIRYFENLLEFTLDRSETNELAKDIWYLLPVQLLYILLYARQNSPEYCSARKSCLPPPAALRQ